MRKESRLYKNCGNLKPFCTVQIGNNVYSDDQIISVEINYGKESSDNSVDIPTATIVIGGKIDLSYNQKVVIKNPVIEKLYPNGYPGIRFVGRVGSQSLDDPGEHGIKKTTIVATSATIRLFRSDRNFTVHGSSTLAHAVNMLSEELSRLKLDIPKIHFTGQMWTDRFFESKEVNTRDIISILEKNAISVCHLRNGHLHVMHPQDRAEKLNSEINSRYAILTSQVLSSAKHTQPLSYLDRRTIVKYREKGKEGILEDDWTKYYLPSGADYPTESSYIDLSDLIYDNEENTRYWRYGIRAATYRSMYLSWQTPTIELDLLKLMNGSEYDKNIFMQIIKSNEGDTIILGGDWDDDIKGPKVIQGYSESITHEGWKIKLSISDSRMVFGYPAWWDVLPRPPARVWNQAKGLAWNGLGRPNFDGVKENGIR